ncbi:MAG: hypothetical protein FWE50_04350 [Alphaproteobacteria bacterium]|nr:hypothetical protein [Alphaproteobacteria bacterium]
MKIVKTDKIDNTFTGVGVLLTIYNIVQILACVSNGQITEAVIAGFITLLLSTGLVAYGRGVRLQKTK